MVKLPRICHACGGKVMHYGRCSCQVGVDDSCGCIFCDLGLDPDVEIEGAKFHHVQRRGNILCERHADPKPMAAYRYDALKSENARLREQVKELHGLVLALLDNDPDDMAADGVTVLDVWRKSARALMEKTNV